MYVVDVVDGRDLLAVNSSLEASHLQVVDFLHLPESELGLVGSYSDSFGQSTHSLPVAQRAQQNGANYVFVSPDNKRVYVASYEDNAIVSFIRNINTGVLTFLEYTVNDNLTSFIQHYNYK